MAGVSRGRDRRGSASCLVAICGKDGSQKLEFGGSCFEGFGVVFSTWGGTAFGTF